MIEADAIKKKFSISVTDLATFCCRGGSVLSGLTNSSSITLSQGQQGQKIIQNNRGPHYQKELSVKQQFETPYCHWQLSGRVDGLFTQPEYIVEEIKTTAYPKAELPSEQHNLHCAQAKLYAAILTQENQLSKLKIWITYYQFHTEKDYQFEYEYTQQELHDFWQQCTEEYSQWLDNYCRYRSNRNASLKNLTFPYQNYREGQRQLSVQTYRDIRDQQQAIYHAPTGLGKTTGILFPALKNLGKGNIKQIWYLTAKTSGQHSVAQSLTRIGKQNLKLRTLVLKAKEKQCLCSESDKQSIDSCPLQRGYFERLKSAREEFQNQTCFLEEDFYQLAKTHRLCPHQLSRDLLPWVDLVVADYNYVFDPYSRLTEYFANNRSITLLIDEAHNLPDRARTMFSESISILQLRKLKPLISDQSLKRQLQKCILGLVNLIELESSPSFTETTLQLLLNTAQQLIEWFSAQSWLLFPSELFESIMSFMRFAQRAQTIEHEDKLFPDPASSTLHIICVDPAPRLQSISSEYHSAHYFSGSLLPLDYFCRALRQQDFPSQLILNSAFPSSNQCTLIYPLNTRYSHRENAISPICELFNTVWSRQPGRYLATFPSYSYMHKVYEQLHRSHPDLPLFLQPQTQSEEQRKEFLNCFTQPQVLAMAISGGLFAEGMDLEKNKLNGVFVIGTSMPPPSATRSLIQQHFDQHSLNGFDFAFRYPGMNRVIQSSGRVIRSERDRGFVILVDDRFNQSQYRALMPAHWQPSTASTLTDVTRIMGEFIESVV